MNKNFYNFTYDLDPNFSQTEIKLRVNKTVSLVGSNKKVLDVGCGFGYLTKIILNNNNDVSAIETSDEAIKYIKSLGIKVYDYDLNLDWAEKIKDKFDVVVNTEVIEHVFDTDKLLNNIYKVLKKGGYLIISTPNVASLGRRLMLLFGVNPILEYTSRKKDAGHIRYFTHKNLSELLKEHGFEICEYYSDYVNIFPSGKYASGFLAKLFPTLGRSLIIKARKL